MYYILFYQPSSLKNQTSRLLLYCTAESWRGLPGNESVAYHEVHLPLLRTLCIFNQLSTKP